MRIGYARVSTHDQNLDLQRDALTQAGCERVIVDVGSGKEGSRVGLTQLREILRRDDVLVVWRLDRLGRSLKHLLEILSNFEKQGIGFHSLTEAIETTTPGGKLVFQIFGAIAEFERNIIRDRTQAGLSAARARGRRGGRPKSLNSDKQALAVDLYRQKKHSIKQICETVGISKPTLYAYVRASGEESPVTA